MSEPPFDSQAGGCEASPGPPTPGQRAAPSLEQEARRGWLTRTALATLRQWGARIGVVWIGVILLAAVFAPFLADSHPFLIHRPHGGYAAPFLHYLSPADVTLLLGFLTAVVLLCLRRLDGRRRVGVWLIILAALVLLTAWPAVGATLLGALRGARQWRWLSLALGWLDRSPGIYAYNGAVLLAAIGGVALLLRPLGRRWGGKLVVFIWLGLACLPFVVFQVQPPRVVVYEQYREAAAAGEMHVLLQAPIPYSPTDRLRDRFNPEHPPPRPPSASHWLGTERYGADILSRMIWASRIALSIGFIATGISLAIGVVIGGLMGYFAGAVDLLGMRLVEIFSSIPQLYLLLAFVAFFGRNLYLIMVIIGLTSWTGYAVFTRAEFLKLRNQDFVQAARACGLPLRSIMFRHMLPNALAPILVSVSFGVASAILAEAMLSFLGLGLVDQPSWGELLDQAVSAGGGFYWWLAIFPGGAIFLTIFAYVLIGEALRDVVDPHTARAAAL